MESYPATPLSIASTTKVMTWLSNYMDGVMNGVAYPVNSVWTRSKGTSHPGLKACRARGFIVSTPDPSINSTGYRHDITDAGRRALTAIRARAERVRKLDNRPKRTSRHGLPAEPSPQHFLGSRLREASHGRITFLHSYEGDRREAAHPVAVARMPWVPFADAALTFCSLPEGGNFRAILEIENDGPDLLDVKDVSGAVVQCMIGAPASRLLWRARIRRDALVTRRCKIMDAEDAAAGAYIDAHT